LIPSSHLFEAIKVDEIYGYEETQEYCIDEDYHLERLRAGYAKIPRTNCRNRLFHT